MAELALRAMRDDEYEAFHSKVITGYATVNVEADNWLSEESVALSRKELENLLPQGRDTRRACCSPPKIL